MSVAPLKAPFPWFGGKSRAASLIWKRFGDVPNYVEPFAGSLAVLLGRPTEPRTETVNDKDCYLANFWRAVQADPEAVARYADWPVNEADLHARHRWLVAQVDFRERMLRDPDHYDAKIAGWWVWGLSCWIGSGFCQGGAIAAKLPHLGDAGRGLHRKRPHLMHKGKGVHRLSLQLPELGSSRGVNSQRGANLIGYFQDLTDRLRRVRVVCGEWDRVLGESVTTKHGVTAVVLDPPYADTANRRADLYREDSLSVAHAAREWALANGDNPLLRIALCGYANQRQTGTNTNSAQERIWFSPHCLKPRTIIGVQTALEML